MFQTDDSNIIFRIAADMVNHTSRNIFLTGKAGTGKTTFLKHIRETSSKQMVIVAPTGVAAINAGGVTIHSFFQLPFSPFVPETLSRDVKIDSTDRHSLLGKLRLNKERRKIIQNLELLIIDEVSMVRCDIIDAIDLILRHVRRRHSEKFGGVQIMFIGDMFQLSPVVKEPEWQLLKRFYASPYFFDSMAVKSDPPVYIELTKVYRQADEKFIALLNQIRNNELDADGQHILDQQFRPGFFENGRDDHILLTTHNIKAREINIAELKKLNARPFVFKAEITGEFPDTAYPADELLELKLGAHVMFIKNDTEKDRRYFNGKMGVIVELTGEKIMVQCKTEAMPIEVNKEAWKNIRYTLNKATQQLDEVVLGEFTQYPLRLAWAITIHKSQGLTFEKAIIDAGHAFAPGQVYVALSRCTSLEGMILHNRIMPSVFFTDEKIVAFAKTRKAPEEITKQLLESKKIYLQQIILSLFDFSAIIHEMEDLQKYFLEHQSSFNPEAINWIKKIILKASDMQQTAIKFHTQLIGLFSTQDTEKGNIQLQERIAAADKYFSVECRKLISFLSDSSIVTDSTVHAKEFNESVKNIFSICSLQLYLLEGLDKIDAEAIQLRRKKFVLPSFSINAYAGASQKKSEVAHPELQYQLRKLRDEICSSKNLPIYFVAGSKTIDEMATYLPQTTEDLLKISGFGKIKADSFGPGFLEIIQTYCQENSLLSVISEKQTKRTRKSLKGVRLDSKLESFKYFKDGIGISEIALQRKLTRQTIEGHLSHYLEIGEIKIEELIKPQKIEMIKKAIEMQPQEGLVALKKNLPEDISFEEIRWVRSFLDAGNG